MKIVFFGSSDFCTPSLKALIAKGYDIACVVTQPDKPKGRGMQVGVTPAKQLAISSGIKIFQPTSVNSVESIAYLRSLGADLFVVIAYGQILSQEVLDIPKIAPINLHASLLPKYRGAAPINWAIINGEKETGVSLMKMVRLMDAGPVLCQESVVIKEADNAINLTEKLSNLGAELLIKGLKLIESGKYELIAQDELKTTCAPKLTKELGLIDWSDPADKILRLIRGINLWPQAHTCLDGHNIKIISASVIEYSGPEKQPAPGKIIETGPQGIIVSCGKGALRIEKLKPEGRKEMTAGEFLRGKN